MSRVMNTAALVGAFAALANAHGRVMKIVADGTEYGGYINDYNYGAEIPSDLVAWSAANPDNGFVDGSNYTSAADIACHINGKPGGGAAKVAAGGKITLDWGDEIWPESHHGPVIDYLAKCAGDDCSSVTAGDLEFFKIDEAGLNDGSSPPGQWASDDLIAAGNKWEVTVPESLAPGQYVLRHEIIALHSAQDTNGAQNYPQCINIEVSGSGSASPSGVTADQLYTPSDAGISLSIYQPLDSYEIPGPALWDGASSGGSSSGGSSSGGSSPSGGVTSEAATVPAATSSVVASAPSSVAETTVSAAAAPTEYGSGSDSGSDASATDYPTPTEAPTPSSPAESQVGGASDVPSAPSAPASAPSAPASSPSEVAPVPSQAYGNGPSAGGSAPPSPPAGGNSTGGGFQPPSPITTGSPAAPGSEDEPCEQGGQGGGRPPMPSFGGAEGSGSDEGPGNGFWKWFKGHGGNGKAEGRVHARDLLRHI